MNSRLQLLAVCAALSASSTSGWAATNLITGTIAASTTWSGTNLVQGTVVVTNGAVVTVEPGTRMLMNTGATLLVYGQLLANGTTNEPIQFTRATTAARWEQIKFIQASNSVFNNCQFEYANSAGDHQAYYPTNCGPPPKFAARNYQEAIVGIATHLEFDGCLFRNLVGGTGGNEGDAIAMISDDPTNSGIASAVVRNSQFIGIGQAVHTRYSHVLVEYCYFTNKHGDNDDIDLYGESTPPPVIRYNYFARGHEDKINPTKCSAIIIGNVVNGSDDHGIVLRDAGRPVLINNLVINCANGGISVQNTCDALLINNTVVNSARGIRLFDHTGRWGPPYCLTPGSGRVTLVNCVIWDCTASVTLEDSIAPNPNSYAQLMYCDVEGGQATVTKAANSTVVWGAGNINADPQFVNLAAGNYRLLGASAAIDVGMNPVVITNWTFSVTNDFDGVARPLDGTGDGVAAYDMGAFEYLKADADSNGDGIPDGWCQQFGFNPLDPGVPAANADGDALSNQQEWIADTNPTNALSWFRIDAISNGPPVGVYFPSSSNRVYTLYASTNLTSDSFRVVGGQRDVPGVHGAGSLTDTNSPGSERYYKVGVKVP